MLKLCTVMARSYSHFVAYQSFVETHSDEEMTTDESRVALQLMSRLKQVQISAARIRTKADRWGNALSRQSSSSFAH